MKMIVELSILIGFIILQFVFFFKTRKKINNLGKIFCSEFDEELMENSWPTPANLVNLVEDKTEDTNERVSDKSENIIREKN